MRTIVVAFIFFFCIAVKAQVKGALIKKDNLILGTWKASDSLNGALLGVPLFGEGEENEFIHFNSGEEASWYAIFLDPENGFACPSYFVAHLKKDVVTGIHTGNCAITEVGKIITFRYEFNKKEDVLTIIFKDKKYRYRRFKK